MTANPIEYNFDICSEDAQYTLHDKDKTTVRFPITLNHVPCNIRLIFTPFRRPGCNLIYHEYEILCIIPHGASVKAVSRLKDLIVVEIQRLYTKCFAKPSHKLVLQTEVEVSSKSGPGYEVASNLVTTAKHQLASNDQPLSKRQKSLQGDRTPPDVGAVLWTVETFNHGGQKTHRSAIPLKQNATTVRWACGNSIEEVQKSYRSAIRDGRLNYDREPQLASGASGTVNSKAWDPYVLSAQMVLHARLDSKKVDSIRESINSVVRIVPKAVEWVAETKKRALAPEDVKRILRRAFVHDKSSSIHQSKLPPILATAAQAFHQANELQKRPDDFRREEAILRIVAYAAVNVSIVAGEPIDDEIDHQIALLAGGQEEWLRQGRWIARTWFWLMRNVPHWKGRELPLFFMLMGRGHDIPLRSLLQPSFPASAGEFVSALSLEVYWKDLPTLTELPGLMEIEMALLDGLVNHETICLAFGCTDAYLEGLDPNLFLELCPKLQLISTVVTSKKREGQTDKDDGLDVDVNTDPCLSFVYDTVKDADDLFFTDFNIP